MKKVKFTQMKDGTKEDYDLLSKYEEKFSKDLPDRVLEALKNLDSSVDGYQVTRLEHSLQSATRAEKDGADEEMVVATLIHDIGDNLAPHNHSQLVASVLRPYVSEKIYWIILHHGIFQEYYYAHHIGRDRNARDKFKDHPYYQDAVDFCEKWDQKSFDPNYESYSLEYFEPKVRKLFSKEPNF
ncbi:HD domain-containing protein [Pelagibacteraceae bacterium]|jgi:predicted HD phosphohydrolase|nr:HD domain-containing protein [Pelagibacteraceae bacterium]|tara:strand:+ start:502 stop:1053 length:552 start_codon:yes stop_codon:yes gene_type:complete